MAKKEKVDESLIWQVTSREGDGINITFGSKLSAMPIEDDAKLTVVGRALIGLGTRLMTSTTEGDDEWEDD